MNATAILDAATPAATIFERAACLSLELRRLGTKRKMNVGDLKPGVESDAEMIHVSKDLLDAPELDAIRKHDGAIRRWLETKVSGPALFRSGVYMISYELLGPVDDELRARLDERARVLVPEFLGVYDRSVDEARRRLGPHFRAEEYPTVERVRETFGAEVRYFTLGAPSGLERIRGDIFAREQEKAASQWQSVLDESRNVLRAEVAELVDHMVDRLTPDASGKGKRFNASLVENLDEFLSNFKARDIADDAELQRVVDEARALLAGVTPRALRNSRAVRDATRARFTEVKTQLDRLVVTGGRSYNLDE